MGEPHKGREDEVRFGLTSESGLNDGLAFPFTNLVIAVAVVGLAPEGWLGDWLPVDILYRVGLAAGYGLTYLLFLVRPLFGMLTFPFSRVPTKSGWP